MSGLARRPSRLACALVALWLSGAAARADPIAPPGGLVVETYGPRQGLPAATVRAVAQQEPGTLYVGTDGGVARFDGGTFEAAPAPPGWAQERTLALHLGDDGLTVQCTAGVYRAQGEAVTVLDDRRLIGISAGFAEDAQRLLLANERGVFRVGPAGLEPVASSPEVTPVTLHRHGDTLLVGAPEGLFAVEGDRLVALDDRPVRRLLETPGGLLVGTHVGVLRYPGFEPVGPRAWVTDLALLPSGAVAASTGSGVLLLHPDGRAETFTRASGLTFDVATRAHVDQDGQLWLGTLGSGLVRIAEPGLRLWRPSSVLGAGLVTDLRTDGDALLVAGLIGAAWVSPALEVEAIETGLHGILEMGRDAEGGWFVSSNGSGTLHRRPGASDFETLWADLPGPQQIEPDGRGGLVLVYAGGVLALDHDAPRDWPAPEIPLYGGHPSADGTLLLHSTRAAWRFHPDRGFTPMAHPVDPCVGPRTAVDGEGGWVACGGAVYRIDARGHTLLAPALPDAPPFEALYADDDALWAVTRGELLRLRPGPLSLRLPDDAIAQDEVVRFGDWLVVGTTQGVAWVDPTLLRATRRPPAVHVAGAWAGDRALTPPLTLRPGEDDLRFALGDDVLLPPSELRYRFRLDGGRWSSPQVDASVQLLGLERGDHTLEIQARAPGTGWSDTPTAVAFTLPPAWYQRGDVRGGALAALLAGLWAYWRERNRRLASELERLQETERFRQVFGRFVAPEVADDALAGRLRRQGERREVTVLIADLRGFTSLSQALAPERLVERLNQWLTAMVHEIEREGGVVDKFMGDAIVAIFGAPRAQADHADRAVRAAQAMVRAGERLGSELRAGVGVNSGEVIAGPIGAASRMEYTVIGEAVNVAARVEALTRTLDADVLVTAATRARLTADYGLVEVGPRDLKGVRQPVGIWRWDRR
ncbi:MAG: hypothetical protein H6739_24610 [Alphaproteobacteria bacterium]|nr:hypothetical protein [Alphaproteobacteria bacterium]